MKQLTVQQSMPIVWAVWDKRLASQLVLAVAGVAALTLSAKFQIPWWPVPMTARSANGLYRLSEDGPARLVRRPHFWIATGALDMLAASGWHTRAIPRHSP
jgi:biotin transport system substrate-specific component